MAAASEFQHLCPGLVVWNAYDSAIKTEFFSAALATNAGVYFVDPIPLTDPALSELKARGAVCGIVVTNNNHERAASAYAASFNVPVFAHPDSFRDGGSFHLTTLNDGETIAGDLRAIAIEGAVPGEIALYHAPNGGTLVVGDALINFEPYGFTFLPRKYCQNEKEMRRSLSQLLKFPAERLIFAHGTPIVAGATERLKQLLDGDL
jgi:glyoxylase-like metal-dependent hydrolase (beta-lactamase superfamily II)